MTALTLNRLIIMLFIPSGECLHFDCMRIGCDKNDNCLLEFHEIKIFAFLNEIILKKRIVFFLQVVYFSHYCQDDAERNTYGLTF